MRSDTHSQCKCSRSQERCSDNSAHLDPSEPKMQEEGWQNYVGDAINECPYAASGDEELCVRACRGGKKGDVMPLVHQQRCLLHDDEGLC